MIPLVGVTEYAHVFLFLDTLFATDSLLTPWPESCCEYVKGQRLLQQDVSNRFYAALTDDIRLVSLERDWAGTAVVAAKSERVFVVFPQSIGPSAKRSIRKMLANPKLDEMLLMMVWNHLHHQIVVHGIPKISRNIESECHKIRRAGERADRQISTIENAARQIRATIYGADVLHPSWRVQTGATPQALHKQVLRQLSVQEQALIAGGVRYAIASCEDKVLMLNDDIDALLSNLVSNAVKYAKRGSEISIRFGPVGETYEISISSMSLAIDEAEVGAVTRVGYRGSRAAKTRADQGEGFGLGLAIVKRIVEAYGGSLRIDAPNSEGELYANNTFTLCIPISMMTAV